MSERSYTTISISKEVWKRLNRLKNTGESMEDVMKRLLDEHEAEES